MPPPVPIPVQPLAYSGAWQERSRPGLITAIGVMCIVVACLSGLVSTMMGFYGLGFYMVSKFAGARSATAAATISAPSSSPQANEKLPIGDVGVADNTLRSLLNLDGPRLHELDKLLRSHGKAIFPPDEDSDGTPLTNAKVRAAVKEYHNAADASGAAHFATEAGAVDVFPDHATFTSADGDTTIRSSALRHSESVSQASMTVGSTTASTGTTLTAAQVQKIMRDIKRLSPKALTAAQISTVQTQLSAPNQQLVTNAAGTPVSSVTPQGTDLMVQFDGGFLNVGPQGQVVQVFSYSSNPFAGGRANLNGVAAPAILMMLEALCSVAVAIYLLVVGIFVFRSSFKSPRLLAVYAWIKIPLALAAGAVVTWMGYEFMTAVTKGLPGGSPAAAPTVAYVAIWGIILTLLGLAFPIALLIALRSRTSREFFNTVSTP
jgi:hypothetical protein